MEYIYTVCSHGGEGSPGIFLYGVYIHRVLSRGRGLAGYIPIWSIYTPCVVTGARARRVYSYMEYIYAVCSKEGEFSSPGLFL